MFNPSDREKVFQLTMRIQLLEAECAALQRTIDSLEEANAKLSESHELLVIRNRRLVTVMDVTSLPLPIIYTDFEFPLKDYELLCGYSVIDLEKE